MRGKVVGVVVAAVMVAATWPTVGGAQTAAAPHAVGVVAETFVDKSRPTAANGDCAKIPSRTLPTTISYPAVQPNGAPDTSGGPYPLVVFSHGFGATAATYAALAEYLASRGYVVAVPTFPLSSGDSPCGAIAGDFVHQPE